MTIDIQKTFESDSEIMQILKIIANLELNDSWLCAGFLRNYVWNVLSGRQSFDTLTDLDIIFHDSTIRYAQTVEMEQKLKEEHPNLNWELKNQVYMHIHNPNTKPCDSSREAIAKFPETCTAIAARLVDGNNIELFLPYGEEDIINFKVRPTPHFESNERRLIYRNRVLKKQWQAKWPQLQIEL